MLYLYVSDYGMKLHLKEILGFQNCFFTTTRRMSFSGKPPNILLYAPTNTLNKSLLTVEMIEKIFKKDKYIVYPVSDNELTTESWKKNATMLILQTHVDKKFSTNISDFLKLGGKVLSLPRQVEFSDNLQQKENYICLDGEFNEELLRKVFSEIYGSDAVQSNLENESLSFSFGYLISEEKSNLPHLKILKQSKITLDFNDYEDCQQEASENYLPIKSGRSCNQFDGQLYLNNLTTSNLGRPLIFVPLITSSMLPFEGKTLGHGFTFVPLRQSAGVGRGGNKWLSPEGCSMFTMQIFLKLDSFLGRRPSLMQHLVALAHVEAVRSMSEFEDIDIRIKWPNDIYYGSSVKLGGVIAKSSITRDDLTVVVGAGFNLNNAQPTTSLNQILKDVHKTELSRELLIARIFNCLEKIIEKCNNGQYSEVESLYYKYWLHSHQHIIVRDKESDSSVIVVGINEFGFLRVKDTNDVQFSVMDDGNSFDMMQGLVKPKLR